MKKLTSIAYWSARPQKDKWVVKFPQGGRRVPRFFVNEKEAKAFAREKEIELFREGTRRSGITPEDRRAIEIASERDFSIFDAVTHYAAHVSVMGRSISVSSAIDELLDIREAENRSNVHLADLRHRLGVFAKEYGNRLVAEVATRDIDSWLTGLAGGAQTKTNYRRAVHNLFRFAMSRGYCSSNPVSSAVKVKVPRGGDRHPDRLPGAGVACGLSAGDPSLRRYRHDRRVARFRNRQTRLERHRRGPRIHRSRRFQNKNRSPPVGRDFGESVSVAYSSSPGKWSGASSVHHLPPQVRQGPQGFRHQRMAGQRVEA
jgi:hypothetical protein